MYLLPRLTVPLAPSIRRRPYRGLTLGVRCFSKFSSAWDDPLRTPWSGNDQDSRSPGLAPQMPGLMGLHGGFRDPHTFLTKSGYNLDKRDWIKQPHGGVQTRGFRIGRSDGESGSRMRRNLGAIGAAAVLLAGKTKWVLAGLKFTKFMPALSMLASTGAYALFFGWPFAVGMVGQIFFHESGHWAVMKYYNIPTGPMTFIPFLGAAVEMRGRPKDVAEEAVVAFGGPVAGGIAALGLSAAGVVTGSPMLIALADFGFMINLFNMLPIGSLDGGRIAGAVSPYMLVAGLAGGIALAFQGMVGNPIFFLILLSGGFTCYERFFGSGVHHSYYGINPAARVWISVFYIALIAALLLGMAWNQQYKKSVRSLRQSNPNVDVGETGRKLENFAYNWMEEDERMRELEREHERQYFGDRSF